MTDDPGPPRTARRRLIAAGLLGIAVLLGVVLALSSTGGFEGKYALPAAGSRTPAGPVGPLPPPVARAAPPRPAAVAPPAPVAADDPDDRDGNGDGDDGGVDAEDADRIAGAIERTTRKALRRGETVEWHKAGERGHVAVSDPRDDGRRICRNVTATIASDRGPTQSRSHLWCLADDEDDDSWEPVR